MTLSHSLILWFHSHVVHITGKTTRWVVSQLRGSHATMPAVISWKTVAEDMTSQKVLR